MRRTLCVSLSAALLTLVVTNIASAQWYRGNLKETIHRLEEDSDHFKKSLDDDLDHSRLNGTQSEDEVNSYVREFESATDRLKSRYDDHQASPALAREVLVRARSINTFMRRYKPGARSTEDWRRVRQSLDRLAYAYRITWRW